MFRASPASPSDGRMRRSYPVLAGTLVVAGFISMLSFSKPLVASGPHRPPEIDSPPRFATRDGPRLVKTIVEGEPVKVELVVTAHNGRSLATGQMSASRDEPAAYSGRIPVFDSKQKNVHYRVRATYHDAAELSDEYFLTYLDELQTASVVFSDVTGTRILTAPLGTGRDALGIVPGNQAATVMPASFAVDEAARLTHILDTANARVVSYDFAGKRVRDTPVKTRSRTVTDILVQPGTGRRYLVDQARDEIIKWDSAGQTILNDVDLESEPRLSRLAADGGSDVFLRKASQGEHAPVVRGTKPVKKEARAAEQHGGATADSSNGINVEVGEDHFVVADTCGFTWGDSQRACPNGSTRGIRVDVAGLVDVRDHALDLSGRFWALGGVIDDATQNLRMLLLRIDLIKGSVTAREVDASVPGDVARQLTPLESGVVLMAGDNDSIELTRYDTL